MFNQQHKEDKKAREMENHLVKALTHGSNTENKKNEDKQFKTQSLIG